MRFRVGDIVWFNKDRNCWLDLPPILVEIVGEFKFSYDVFYCKVLRDYMPIWVNSMHCNDDNKLAGFITIHTDYLTRNSDYSDSVEVDVSEYL